MLAPPELNPQADRVVSLMAAVERLLRLAGWSTFPRGTPLHRMAGRVVGAFAEKDWTAAQSAAAELLYAASVELLPKS